MPLLNILQVVESDLGVRAFQQPAIVAEGSARTVGIKWARFRNSYPMRISG
jgi:hypothetical protein